MTVCFTILGGGGGFSFISVCVDLMFSSFLGGHHKLASGVHTERCKHGTEFYQDVPGDGSAYGLEGQLPAV